MEILNLISWIKAGNYRATLPTDVISLIPVGTKAALHAKIKTNRENLLLKMMLN
jgi:hypothetical protein